MDVAAAGMGSHNAHAQRFVQTQGSPAGKKRVRVFITQDYGRHVQAKFVNNSGFQKTESQVPAPFAQKVGAVQFFPQGLEHVGQVGAAAQRRAKGKHTHADIAQGFGRGRSGGSGRSQKHGLLWPFFQQVKIRVGLRQARREHACQRLAAVGLVIAEGAHGEARVVRAKGAAAHKHSAAATADASPQSLHFLPRFFGADPLGFAPACGNAAIKGGGHLQNDVGPLLLLPDQKVGHKVAAGISAYALDNFQTAFAQLACAAAGFGIGVGKAHHDFLDPRLTHGIGAGRRLALVAAGFQRHNKSALGRIHSPGGSVFQAIHLGVVKPCGMVPPPGYNMTVTHKHRAHHGVGAGFPAALSRQGNGFAHEGGVIQFRHGIYSGWGLMTGGMKLSRSTCTPASASMVVASSSG